MPPTPDRTTIQSAFDALMARLRAVLVADPPTPAAPFYGAIAGTPAPTSHPRPFLAVTVVAAEPIGGISGDKLIRVALGLHIVTDVGQTDPHAEIVDKIGAVDDFFDNTIQTGLIEGAQGFDDRNWQIDMAVATSGSRTAGAAARQSMIVKVARNQNRIPAS
ncbi:MAG: hypothetical protein ACE5E5_13320 [Phycisphaerae bacterium]